jgi:hypothetical protein
MPSPSALPARPHSNAIRSRRFRARQRNGLAIYRLTLNQVDAEELLITARTLAPEARDDHAAVEFALHRFIELLIADHRTRE